MEYSKSLAPHTGKVFEAISHLECIKPYTLVGGTAMLRRSKFRDYYDIYSILKEGKDLQKMIDAALEHSNHKLRTRGTLNILLLIFYAFFVHKDVQGQFQKPLTSSPLTFL